MRIEKALTLYEKLNILTDAAKYDVACTSSGTERKNDGNGTGSCQQSGICHSFSADGRCISLLKILFTNECIYDCKYCVNRRTNDVMRTSFTPEEVCTLTMEFYRRNYIEGLFLSSGVLKSPDYTMELLYATLHKLRTEYRFQGYIHVKAIPGASQELIRRIGFLADRMSVNLELPTAEGLKLLAPHKTRKKILTPMRLVQNGMEENNASVIVDSITKGWLGAVGGVLAILGVIAAPITSGDTAFRSARLIVADFLGLEQKSMRRRLYICIPMFVAAIGLLLYSLSDANGFNMIWRYFAWANQTLAVFTLWAITVYLVRSGKPYWITLIPALFMTAVCSTYICIAPEGLGLTHTLSYIIGGICTGVGVAWFIVWKGRSALKNNK